MNNMIKFQNFETYVLRKLETNYSQFYSSYEEYLEHMLSGEVTVPITFMLELQHDFEMQLPCECDKVETDVLTEATKQFIERHPAFQ